MHAETRRGNLLDSGHLKGPDGRIILKRYGLIKETVKTEGGWNWLRIVTNG
jgi:hypothetical protein